MSSGFDVGAAAAVKQRVKIRSDQVVDLFGRERMERLQGEVADAVDEAIKGSEGFKQVSCGLEIG